MLNLGRLGRFDEMPPKIPTGDWLQSKFGRLLEMTEVVSKECPGQYSEPKYGFWSLKKEIALMYWIWPFLQIASQYFDSFYYIDLFAGSGLMKANSDYFVGSPIVAVGSTLPDKKFSEYICFETDSSRKEALEKRAKIASKHFGTCSPRVFGVDCNKELTRILNEFCRNENACYLAFIDPEGISDLKWDTLHSLLVHGKGDLILNFPTLGIIRNFNQSKSESALTAFFGDIRWKNVVPNPDNLIEYYKSKISAVKGFGTRVDNLPVTDELRHRLYDLIFATGSRGMSNVIRDLKKHLDKIQTKDLRQIHEVMGAGTQSQLTRF
jgi:three-Cys-motif partner protein